MRRVPEPRPERFLGRVPGLDGVRGLGVLLVVGLHLGFILSPRKGGLLTGGWVGVDVFFVLSGFLITSLLLDERAKTRGIAFGAFYIRRACRLLPALAALLAAHVVYAMVKGLPMRIEAKAVLAIAAYASNWAQAFGFAMPKGLVHTWTLSVEEQFYFVWPTALLVLVKTARSRRTIVAVLVAAIAASASIRVWIWVFGSGFPAAYMRTDARADGLLIGALFAFLWRWQVLPRRLVNAAASAALVGIGVIAVFWSNQSPTLFYGGFTVAAVAAAMIIVAVADGDWRPSAVFETRPLRAVGRVSYGLYLWHILVLYIIAPEIPDWPPVAKATLIAAVSAAMTYASWQIVEKPFLRLKERWSQARRITSGGDAIPVGESEAGDALVGGDVSVAAREDDFLR
jgi:peptidoglycan/LPS O-acetylase OafA/YrhL